MTATSGTESDRIIVDRELCTGAGVCVITAPTVFAQDDLDGRVVLLAEEPGENEADDVEEAIRFCPARALSLASD